MIDGGAHDRETQRDVDRFTETRVLEHGQTLVVVHRQYRVLVTGGLCERGVRRQRAAHVLALSSELRHDRCDDLRIFGAQVSVFSGMRIQPADDDLGCSNTETMPQVVQKNAEDVAQPAGRYRVRHIAQRQVSGSECNAQLAGSQQHYRQRRVTALREKLGVPAERNSRVVDDALVQRCGDQRAIAALQAAFDGMP